MISAVCCRHGVACTSQPVFRSCRLSLEIAATATTTEVQNNASAVMKRTDSGLPSRSCAWPMPMKIMDEARMAITAMTEIGLADEPTRTAIEQQAAATQKQNTKANTNPSYS